MRVPYVIGSAHVNKGLPYFTISRTTWTNHIVTNVTFKQRTSSAHSSKCVDSLQD